MLGTMYQGSHHALPKAYGSYGRSRSNGNSVVSTLAIVVLLVACGGLSLAIVSSRAHVKDVMIHHEALVNELTHTKNHLHQIEAQLAHREAELQTVQQDMHQLTLQNPAQHELVSLRDEKRTLERSLSLATDEAARVKHELEASQALVEAYKQHLSDEVASHHQREDNWLHIQEDWERLEKEMEAEILSLRNQLQQAKLAVPSAHEHHMPQHIAAEPARPHDPLYDHLPPAHVQQLQQQQQQQQQQPAPVPVPAQQQHQQHPPVPVPVQHQHQQHQQHAASPTPAPVEHAAPVPLHELPPHHHHQQHQPAPGPAVAPAHAEQHPPPQPHEAHHDDTHNWQHDWQANDYQQYFEHHNHYADYPGWVDEGAGVEHTDGSAHHDAGHHWEHDAHHHDAHHDPQQQQQQHGHVDPHAADHQWDWHHQDDSHHFHQEQQQHGDHDAHQQQQHGHEEQAQHHNGGWNHDDGHGHEVYQAHHDDWQQHHDQQHHDPHAAAIAQDWHNQQQQQQPQHGQAQAHHDAHAAQQQAHHHHAHDDLSMKLGLGGEPHEQQQWHH